MPDDNARRGGVVGGVIHEDEDDDDESQSQLLPVASKLYVVKGGKIKEIELMTKSVDNPRTYMKVMYDLRDALIHD
ncbi:MAG: hypothetical protein QXS96_04765 [Candidatus Caldarchaeum sp.]